MVPTTDQKTAAIGKQVDISNNTNKEKKEKKEKTKEKNQQEE